ncbi:MAG TPA: sulfatase [Candidatus Hydrogenedentes bacterium]|nr:sulfatase [Candidatus Hydrogenedentota bacterium]HPG68833.1 sulfatase [Candidatus Hydrogenedentota bacterium]
MTKTTRRHFLGQAFAGATAFACGRSVWAAVDSPKPTTNVLFIAVDDLRPQLGCYGDKVVKSPNLDRLAADGTVFTRAYCQQAVCSPSRTSLLTGRRPDTTLVYDLETHFRKTIPDVVTLPEQFKREGYHAQGLSKLYHGGLDDAQSWSVPWWKPEAQTYHLPQNVTDLAKRTAEAQAAGVKPSQIGRWPRGVPTEAPDIADNELADGKTADRAIEVLNAIKGGPFFLGVGFLKPHLPFIAPKKYWDLYPRDQLSLADNPFAPKDCPQYALTNWGELRHYVGVPKVGPLSDEQALELIHGYYACASYTDAQIGRVVDALERLGLRDNTVIVVWGDHGWQLGEHGLWCKHTNFETSVHAPLICSAPKQKTRGVSCDALVEFVDIYPSMCELCGVPLPDGLEGASFAPLLDEPARPWKTAAFSQYPRYVDGVGRIMGYSMRTDRYRLTEWRGLEKDFTEYELYDHETDPKENVNIAQRPENAALVKQLAAQLQAGWRAALPPGAIS